MCEEICGTLHDSVPFVQFKKHEKHQRRSVNFSKVAGITSHLNKAANLMSYSGKAGTISNYKSAWGKSVSWCGQAGKISKYKLA